MPGSPLKRQRREEAEAAARASGRARRVSVADRAAALQRAEIVGDQAAAVEFGVKPATIRSWRRRAKDAPVEQRVVPVEASGGETAVDAVAVDVDAPDLEQLRRTALNASRVAERALEALEGALQASRNPQAIAVAFGVSVDKARELREAVQALENHQISLSEAQGRVLADVISAAFWALRLTPPAEILRHLLDQASRGETLSVPGELVDAADEVLRRDLESPSQEFSQWGSPKNVRQEALPSPVEAVAELPDAEVVEPQGDDALVEPASEIVQPADQFSPHEDADGGPDSVRPSVPLEESGVLVRRVSTAKRPSRTPWHREMGGG